MTKEFRNLCPEFQQKKLKTMNESTMVNVTTTQRRRYYIGISMNESIIANVATTQLGTSCFFDSPGLARNEPTPGKHSQRDSTP